MYHLWVTVTNLVSRICIMSGGYPIIFEIGIPNSVWMHLGMAECLIPFSVYCDLDQVLRTILLRAYLLYIFLRRNPKNGVWMHLGIAECCITALGHYAFAV